MGEQPPVGPPQGVSLDSFASPVHVEWDSGAALTLLYTLNRSPRGPTNGVQFSLTSQ